MKLFLLTAAAVLATPALAQTGNTPQSGTQSGTTTPDSATPATPADQAPPAADGTMTAPSTPAPATDGTMTAPSTPAPATDGTMTAPAAPAQTTGSMPMSTTTGDPVGGYQPTAPALSGTPTAGGTVRFQQAPAPSEAYPAPAPLASYPRCRPGQFDKCMQGPGSTHSRQVRGRRHSG